MAKCRPITEQDDMDILGDLEAGEYISYDDFVRLNY